MKTLLLCLFVAASFVACSKSDDSKTSSYKYDLTENGCATGSHEFSSQADMCQGLQNNALNNNCASTLRAQMFQSSCSGTYTPFGEDAFLEDLDDELSLIL